MNTRCLLAAAVLAGCSSVDSVGFDETADVMGDFSIALTNAKNGCALDGWTEGSTTQNIPVTIAQTGTSVTATVGGGAGLVLNLAYGGAKYDGTVSGHHLEATLFGMNTRRSGNCVYTMKSVIRADLQGDFLTGTVSHQPAPNGNPDCRTVVCSSDQSFNGTRPPKK